MSIDIGWSNFALGRYKPGSSHSHFTGTNEELLTLVREHWRTRRPGAGRDGLNEVVIVSCPPERFVCGTVLVDENTAIRALFRKRQAHEDGYVEIRAAGPRESALVADVVLYSSATLLANGGEQSGDYDWEIVSIQAGSTPDEPMHPLTMARNLLARPGGTPCEYSAREFAEAIYYWSCRCSIDPEAARD
ncbi:MAG: DUF3228 family protein [bacterium]|nr:DUF3228 family protein [bacterium]